ncbi:unnamed protein product, partial [Rotaria sp. Silwood2]
EQNNNTSTSVPSPPPLPSSSNGIYEQRLYDLKHLIVEKLLDNLDEYLLNNSILNGLNSIDYLQLLLTLTIDFASKSEEDNQQFVRYISIQCCLNWQKIYKSDSLVPFILQFLINSISSSTTTSNHTLKTSK